MPTLSVIIPVYNVAPYLRACLDSVCVAVANAQKVFQDLTAEIICVDDGSTDGSGAILDEYMEQVGRKVEKRGGGGVWNGKPSLGISSPSHPPHFCVIHQANAGVSVARNVALDAATGDWVMMIDGDDTWTPDLLVRLFDHIKVYDQCDAVAFSIVKVNDDGERIAPHGDHLPLKVMSGDDVLADCKGPYSQFIWSSCDKIYRRSIVERQRLRYAVGMRRGEDLFFTQLFLAHAKMVVLDASIEGYCYLMRLNSAVHTKYTSVDDEQIRTFCGLHEHWRLLQTPGLKKRLLVWGAGLLSLGKGDAYESGLRSSAIELLLRSREVTHIVIPFLIRHGTNKVRFFALVYFVSPRVVRRFILERL